MNPPSDTGFRISRETLPLSEINSLRIEADRLLSPAASAGRRDFLRESPQIAELAATSAARLGIPPGLECVRGIIFDKTPGSNWPVAWHQDLTIAVREKKDVSGFGQWTRKNHYWQVQPPVTLLQSMWTVRIHLDDTGPANGPLRVIPGSHRMGRLSHESIRTLCESAEEVACYARAGDALLMSPLLLHASSRAVRPVRRRVIHLEFAPPEALDERLTWAERATEGVIPE